MATKSRSRAPKAEAAPAAEPQSSEAASPPPDLLGGLSEAIQSLAGLKIPAEALAAVQADYVVRATALWNESLQQGTATTQAATQTLKDKRFAAPAWSGNPADSFMAKLYLLNGQALQALADQIEGEEKTRQRVRFAVQQWVDAVAPSNYLALNPDAMGLALQSQGESLAKGMQLLWADLQRGHIAQTDERAFEIGRNVATTAGHVVFENEFFQLLEYKPLTPQVHERALLMVPPSINKFYILDLQPDNSLIRYAVEQGHRTFVISWRNPDESCAHWSWDDVIEGAVIKAIQVVQEISGNSTINTLGFCVGGTFLATALAVLAARGEQPAESVTLLTTLIDFANTGVLDIFIDEGSVKLREMSLGSHAQGNPKGPALLRGRELASTFSMLRPNDLVWNYVVGNYLKGEAPPAFDLLYWNGDATNMAGPMYCWYLRHTYLQNELIVPGRLKVCGVPLDLSLIQAPVYIYGSREDHIVPWDAAYRSTQVFSGKKRFVLGASGHIAGVINPPAKKKRSHWTGKPGVLPAHSADWLAKAVEQPGSWWPDWSQWLASHAGAKKTAPRAPGNRKHPAIEPAPGRYVKQTA